MPVDVNQNVEFQASPVRLFLLAMLALGFAILSFTAAWPLLASVTPGSFVQLAGWVGMPLFFGSFLVLARRYLKSDLPTIELSPQGFRDSRLSSALVSWANVENLSVWDYKSNKMLIVKVSDATWRKLPLSRMARWTRAANRSLGINGLCIATTEFSIKFDELFGIFAAYLEAHGGKVD